MIFAQIHTSVTNNADNCRPGHENFVIVIGIIQAERHKLLIGLKWQEIEKIENKMKKQGHF